VWRLGFVRALLIQPIPPRLLLIDRGLALPTLDEGLDVHLRTVALDRVEELLGADVNEKFASLGVSRIRKRVRPSDPTREAHHVEAQLSRVPRLPVGDFDIEPLSRLALAVDGVNSAKGDPW